MSGANATLRILALIRFAIVITLTMEGMLVSAQDAPPTDIISSAECLNAKKPNDLAGTVVCMPDGCKITLNMSIFSDQKACFIPDPTNTEGRRFQAPHVLLNCPGPKPGLRLRPSYSLCFGAASPGNNEIEYGEDPEYADNNKVPGRKLKMAAVGKFPVGSFGGVRWPVGPEIFNQPPGAGTHGCNTRLCHPGSDRDTTTLEWNNKTFKALFSPPNDPFGFVMHRNLDMVDVVIYTTEPNKKNLSYPVTEVCNKDCRPQTLGEVCANLAKLNGDEFKRRSALCQALLDYEQKRSCGAMKRDGVQLQCKGIVGGGLFMKKGDANALSAVNLDFSGQATEKPAGTFNFLDIDGRLSAANYKARLKVVSLGLSTLVVTKGQGSALDFKGEGEALVNDGQKTIEFSGAVSGNPSKTTIKINLKGGAVLLQGDESITATFQLN